LDALGLALAAGSGVLNDFANADCDLTGTMAAKKRERAAGCHVCRILVGLQDRHAALDLMNKWIAQDA
jgi:hypothetical protein